MSKYAIKSRIILFAVLVIILNVTNVLSEVIKRDDFQDQKLWWNMGSSHTLPPSIFNGVVYLELNSAYDSIHCETYLWDGENNYQNYTATMRIKTLTPMRPGTRGWGFWDFDGDMGLNETIDARISWFMQQYDPYNSSQTWWLAGTRNGRNEGFNYSDLNSIIDNGEWHTYKIIRETDFVAFYVDENLVHLSETAVPDEPQSFHLWIDNFIYPWNP